MNTLSLSCIIVTTLKLTDRLRKEDLRVDAEIPAIRRKVLEILQKCLNNQNTPIKMTL